MSNKVAIIGAGASGLLCSIFCAKGGVKVDLYEQNFKPAKKILVSGNGRCNISNANLNATDYFSQNPSFVEFALKEFGFEPFKKFCSDIGLLLNVLDDGRAYPLSNEAKSVAGIFEEYARNLGVVFHMDSKIDSIRELTNKYDSVVIATGSRAGEHLGGNSDGEKFALEFAHTIIPAYPSLVQLHLDSKIAPKMSGTKLNTEVTLLINAQKELSISGDVLFTNYGVSGFAILDISQAASEALMNYQAVDISINLLPNFNAQKLSNHIAKVASSNPNTTILSILSGLIPNKIANGLLEEIATPNRLKGSQIHTKLTKKIASKLLDWRFEVSDTHGFRHAEVSGGGVNTNEINHKTMESLKHENIYFIGEVLDVVGKRGGYNFAFAWASGFLAARSICNQ
ncbi:MAG: NAD(P)/FAD-dependent oxidoreductase [Campylobacterota bacterium]|nr:NAD(P)/FAD-dependent oxidoreductase [Campylobacterota bacterium]